MTGVDKRQRLLAGFPVSDDTFDLAQRLATSKAEPSGFDLADRVSQSACPALYRAMQPRRYRNVPGYAPSAVAAGVSYRCLLSLLHFERAEPPRPGAVDRQEAAEIAQGLFVMYTAVQLIRHRVPTWFVGKEMFEALANTTPPSVTVSELKLPVPAGVFLLPQDAEVEYSPPAFLAWSVEGGELPALPGALAGNPTAKIAWECLGELNLPHKYLHLLAVTFDPATGPNGLGQILFSASVPLDQAIDINRMTKVDIGDTTLAEAGQTGVDDGIRNFFVNAVLLMANYPEMLETGSLLERAKERIGRGPVTKTEYWAPNWLGRRYKRVKRSDGMSESSHASPMFHWRKGHWRNQACGEGRKDRKQVWIEPHPVGLNEDEDGDP